MSKRRKAASLPSSLPVAARKMFERFPSVSWVDESVYRKRFADLLATLQPSSTIEALWAKDIVDSTIEIEILRQVEAALLETEDRDVDRVHDLVERTTAEVRAGFKLYDWARNKGLDHRSDTPEIRAQFDRFVKEELESWSQHRTFQNKTAGPDNLLRSFLRHGADLNRIGRMIALAEARRRSAFHELERYRTAQRGRPRGTSIIVAADA